LKDSALLSAIGQVQIKFVYQPSES